MPFLGGWRHVVRYRLERKKFQGSVEKTLSFRVSKLYHRFPIWMIAVVTLLAGGDALAKRKLPMGNVVTTFAADQDVAMAMFGLRPVVWGWILAVFAVVVAALLLWKFRFGAPVDHSVLGPDIDEPVHRRWLAAIVAAVTCLHLPGLGGDFNIYDDLNRIQNNDMVKKLTWDNVGKVLLENPGGDNQELMLLSFQFCWKVFGDHYWGWYAFNLVFFVGLLLLVDRLARRLVNHRLVALVTVALVGTSPIFTEMLCWMSVRCHLLGLFFSMACFVSYLEYRRSTTRRWRWLVLALFCFATSQMCKPLFLYVPLWLLCFDLWDRRRDWLKLALEKLVFVLVGALFLRKALAGATSVRRIRQDWLGGSLSNTLAQDANHLLEYLRASVMPLETGLHVPWNAASSWLYVEGVPEVLVLGFSPAASLLILLSIVTVAAVWALRSFRLPGMVLLCSLLSFVTVLNIPVHNTVFAYRYTISSRILCALLLGFLVVWGWQGLQHRHSVWRWLGVAVAASWLTLSAVTADANREAWHDSVSLWSRNAELYPMDGWSHYYAGKAYQKVGKPDYALPHLLQAKKRIPKFSNTDRRLGDVYYALGFKKAAAKSYRIHFTGTQKVSPFYRKRLRELDRMNSPE